MTIIGNYSDSVYVVIAFEIDEAIYFDIASISDIDSDNVGSEVYSEGFYESIG